jgi:hypothetical protein
MPTTRLRFQNGLLYDGVRAYGLSLYMGNELRELAPDPQTRSSRSRWALENPGMFLGTEKAIPNSLAVVFGRSSRTFGLGSGDGVLNALLLRWRLNGSRIMGSVGAFRGPRLGGWFEGRFASAKDEASCTTIQHRRNRESATKKALQRL